MAPSPAQAGMRRLRAKRSGCEAATSKVHLVAMINQGTHRGLMLTAAALGAKLLWDVGQFVAQRRQATVAAHMMA